MNFDSENIVSVIKMAQTVADENARLVYVNAVAGKLSITTKPTPSTVETIHPVGANNGRS